MQIFAVYAMYGFEGLGHIFVTVLHNAISCGCHIFFKEACLASDP